MRTPAEASRHRIAFTATVAALVVFALAALAALGAGGARAAGLSFSAPLQLPDSNPDAHPVYSGGEPSLAFDPSDGHVYVSSPQSLPSVLNVLAGTTDARQGV